MSRALTSLGLVVICTASLVGCSSEVSESENSEGTSSSTERTVIRVASVNDGLTFAFRDISPEFVDSPYDIEYVEMTSADSLSAVSAGQVDIAHLTQLIPALIAQGNSGNTWTENSAPFKIVAGWNNPEHPGVSLVVKDPSITSPAELRGKKIGLNPSSLHQVFWLELSREFDLEDVEVVLAPSPETRSAFLSGALDAVITLHRNARTFEDRGQGTIIDTSSRVIDYYLVSIASRDALLNPEKAAAIADLLDRTNRSMTWVRNNPQALIDYFLERGWIEEGEAEELVSFEPRPRVPFDEETKRILERIAELFFQEGLADVLVDPEIIIDRRFDEGVVRQQ